MQKRTCLIWILLIAPVLCLAQTYSFQQYGVEDGMAQSNVNHIAQDRFGNLWIGTSGGLSYFDGYAFKNFYVQNGLENLKINHLAEDSEGNMLIATGSGLVIYDGIDFTVYPFKGPQGTNASVKKAFEDKNKNIWVLTFNNHLGRLQGDSIAAFLSDTTLANEIVTDIAEDKSGALWLSTWSGHLFRYENELLAQVPLVTKKSLTFYDIFADSRNILWLITDNGLLAYDAEHQQAELHEINYWPNLTITSLAEDNEGYLWIGTSNGTFKYDVQQQKIQEKTHSLKNSIIQDIFTDREGNVWFGTYGEGLHKFKGESFSKLRKAEGLSNNIIFSILKDRKQNYWFGYLPGGIDRYDGKEIRHYGKEDGLSSELILCSVEDDAGNIWFGTFDGLNQFDGNTFQVHGLQEGLPHRSILSAYKDTNGQLWFGTATGIVTYTENDEFEVLYLKGGKPLNDQVLAIKQLTDGRIIFNTGKQFYVVENERIQPFIKEEQLLGAGIQAFVVDSSDYVWWATHDAQIMKYSEEEDTIIVLNRNNAIPQMQVFSMVIARDSSMMVGTERGVSCLKFDENNNLIGIKHYGESEGFLGTETNPGAVFTEPDGSIWFGSVKGAYKYNIEEDHRNYVPPLVHLTDIKLFYEDVNWQEMTDSVRRWYNIPVDLKLPYDQNHLVFEFKGNSLKNPEAIRYQFMLENFDNSWSPVTDRMEAVYANLPPGAYTFHVKAANGDGIWNLHPASFNFNITPPFWQTWWFYMLVSAGMIGLVRGIIIYRVRQEKERNRQLEKEVKARTREIQALNESLEQRVKERTVELELSNEKLEKEFELRKIDQEKYKFLAENTQDIISLHNREMHYLYVSPRIREVAGHNPEDMMGKGKLEFIHPEDVDLHNQLWSRVLNGEQLESKVYRLRNKNGDYSWYETFHRPIVDETGIVNIIISSSRDITEKVKLTQEVDEVRKKVARDFHDEMGNNLASISVLSQLIQAKLGTNHNGVSGLLLKIDTASRNLFNGTRDFIWAIDPRNDYLKEVFFNLKDFGEELFDNTGINFYSSYENPFEKDLKLPSGWSRQIVLIYKEALTNSLKYSKAPHVYLTFNLHAPGIFTICLSDDGVGFELEKKESLSRGIHNMRGRAEKIGVDFSINSETMQGTKVDLQAKITQNGGEGY